MVRLKNQKVGLFFGSFNPIHQGHLMLANYIVEFTELRHVWFVISPHNPLKKRQTLLEDHHRYQLVQVAIEDNPNFYASTIEFDMPKPSYTIDTLTYLQERYPEKEFYLICGSDIVQQLHKWKNHQQIIDNYHIMVYNRPNYDESAYIGHPSFQFIDAPQFEISSSFIRKSLKEKKNMRYFLPEKVYQYILKMGFYESD